MTTKYAHLELNKDVKCIAGYYTPMREVGLKYDGRELLYVVGQAVMESSCCGSSSSAYVLVPGYIVRWQAEKSQAGLPVSEVEPVSDKAEQQEIRRRIQNAEGALQIDFW